MMTLAGGDMGGWVDGGMARKTDGGRRRRNPPESVSLILHLPHPYQMSKAGRAGKWEGGRET